MNRKAYFLIFIALLMIEVSIALFVTDRFVRPYVGDYLVIPLLYCFGQMIRRSDPVRSTLAVLAFAWSLEILQGFNLVAILGFEQYTIARVVIGTSFAWGDLLAYTLGALTIIITEKAYGERIFC